MYLFWRELGVDELLLKPPLVYLMYIQTRCMPQWTMIHAPVNHNHVPTISNCSPSPLFPQSTTALLGVKTFCTEQSVPHSDSCLNIQVSMAYTFTKLFFKLNLEKLSKRTQLIHSSSFLRSRQNKREMKPSN